MQCVWQSITFQESSLKSTPLRRRMRRHRLVFMSALVSEKAVWTPAVSSQRIEPETDMLIGPGLVAVLL